MLGECKSHGYFRGEKCPNCEEAGRFLMDAEELDRVGRMLTGILRHSPERYGLALDEHGWIQGDAIIGAIQRNPRYHWIRPYHIEAIAATDDKGRYQIEAGMIRATYGHTLEVDLSDMPDADLEFLYYPASEEEADMILENGIKPMDRKYIHLSATPEKADEAGRVRIQNPIILKIDVRRAIEIMPEKPIKKAGKSVYITQEVPAKCISKHV
ncbi:MAG: RNA 2'-phosphotransferase [Thermoplasmata archaeon HGW-Thermoplasmata-2]|nr:MAG: RNA 2'-phosphotransferase [Thermoplasmata archaeon HGW-Thermoplasmata-2]